MPLPTFYDTGSVNLTSGSKTVTGTGTGWGGDVLLPGDLFCDPAQPLVPPQRIASVTDGTHLELWAPWPGDDMAAAAYEVRFVGNIERSTAQTRRYLEMLGQLTALGIQPDAQGQFVDREVYDDVAKGFIYLSRDGDGLTGVWTLYTKLSGTSGDWSTGQTIEGKEGKQGNPGLIGDWREAWAPGTYNELEAVEHNGSSYMVKVGVVSTTQEPPGSDWQLVAGRGDEGPSAYEVAVAEGFVGDETAWLASLAGADGLGVPPGGSTGQVLKKASNADNDTVWAAEAGGVADGSVTNAKLANMATATIKGRATAGAGVPEDLTATQALTLLKNAGAYAKDNILGTVAQSVGVPTGAVIERGSNANGEYVKFADGTMICTRSVVFSGAALTTSYGSMFSTVAASGPVFPATFAAIPNVTITPVMASPGAKWAAVYDASFNTTQWPSYLVFDALSRASISGVLQFIAVGRWF